jgi:hypothetical protein
MWKFMLAICVLGALLISGFGRVSEEVDDG